MAATTVSRRELTRWASEVSGGRISNLEKQCCTGAIYCQMIEAARPGVVDMRKVNLDADKNNALGNYKALQVALGKIGVESASMDIQNLTNGQPQATMDLLQSLHQHLGGEGGGEAQTPRGLSNLDPNVDNSGSRKRKAALPGGPAQIRKARTAKALEMEASLEVVAEDGGAAEAAEASRTDSLESELLACGGRLRRSEEEACAAREEADFYYAKLARIEVRCSAAHSPLFPPPSPPHATGPSSPHRRATIILTTTPHPTTPHKPPPPCELHPSHHTPHYTPLQEACELIGATELAAVVVSILREEEEAEAEQPPPPSPQAEAGITA